MKHQHQYQNDLETYRLKMGFRTSHVARLLEHRDTSVLAEYERGDRLPSLVNAFCLGIILRTPVEFLFHSLYTELRKQIRAEEERLAKPRKQVLFEKDARRQHEHP